MFPSPSPLTISQPCTPFPLVLPTVTPTNLAARHLITIRVPLLDTRTCSQSPSSGIKPPSALWWLTSIPGAIFLHRYLCPARVHSHSRCPELPAPFAPSRSLPHGTACCPPANCFFPRRHHYLLPSTCCHNGLSRLLAVLLLQHCSACSQSPCSAQLSPHPTLTSRVSIHSHLLSTKSPFCPWKPRELPGDTPIPPRLVILFPSSFLLKKEYH